MNDEVEKLFSAWCYRDNVNIVTQWHNMTRNAYSLLLEKSKSDEDLNKTEKQWYRNIMNGHMDHTLRNYCLIMHLSNFEEISYTVCHSEGISIPSGGSLKRFKDGWEKRTARKVGDISYWRTLRDAEKVRHCILHAAGRLSFMGNSEEIESIVSKESLSVENGRLVLSATFVNKVINAIVGMVELNA